MEEVGNRLMDVKTPEQKSNVVTCFLMVVLSDALSRLKEEIKSKMSKCQT